MDGERPVIALLDAPDVRFFSHSRRRVVATPTLPSCDTFSLRRAPSLTSSPAVYSAFHHSSHNPSPSLPTPPLPNPSVIPAAFFHLLPSSSGSISQHLTLNLGRISRVNNPQFHSIREKSAGMLSEWHLPDYLQAHKRRRRCSNCRAASCELLLIAVCSFKWCL